MFSDHPLEQRDIDDLLVEDDWFLTEPKSENEIKPENKHQVFVVEEIEDDIEVEDEEEEEKVFNDDLSSIKNQFPTQKQFEDASFQLPIVDNQIQQEAYLNLMKMRQYTQEIQRLMEIIVHRFSPFEKLSIRLKESINLLQIFELQLRIINGLLVGESQNIIDELKQQLPQNNPELHINAKSKEEINFVMFGIIKKCILDDQLPRHLAVCQKNIKGNVKKQVSQLIHEFKIINSWQQMIDRVLGSAIDLPLTDLLSLDRTHPHWQLMDQHIKRKKLADAKQIQKSYYNFSKVIRLSHALVFKSNNFNSPLMKKLVFGLSTIWAKKRCISHICDLKLQSALEVMNLIELPGIKHMMNLGLPYIAYNKKIYIDSIVPPITMEKMKQERINKTINKITPHALELINLGIHNDENYKQLLFQKNTSKVRIRILCHEKLEEPQDQEEYDEVEGWFRKMFDKLTLTKQQKYFDKIIIHIHGGGFISMSSGSHQSYTREWALKLKVPIFSIDYSLAPKYPYPEAVDDCWQAYNWILNCVHRFFNVIPNKVILAGDSAGGNICCAITGLAIKYGQQVCDGLLLAYPVLDMKMKYSPSHQKGLTDYMLSHTVMDICINAYTKHKDSDPINDCIMSPAFLSQEILQRFPPVRMQGGENDPIRDHGYRFLLKLLQAGVDAELIEYEEMSHGFWNFYTMRGMREAATCIDDSLELLKELFNNNGKKQ